MTLFHPPARLTVPQLLAATGGTLLAGPSDGVWTLCTDTRELTPGAVFVALRGENHDGHDYLEQALVTGGALVEVGPAPLPAAGPVIAVPDTLVALGDIARAFLLRSDPSVAAVTGSVGKTTTRAMLASILAEVAPGLSTEGNFNNRIGVPLTLLGLRPEHRWAVLEMGMSEPGEIRALAAIARPLVRVITEVAAVHLEFFESVEGIADAKGELFEDARPGDVLVFPADHALRHRFPTPPGSVLVPFGRSIASDAPVRPVSIEDRGLAGTAARIHVHGHEFDVTVPIAGRHQLHNALAAAAAAWALGAREDHIRRGLATVEVPGRRMSVEERDGVLVVDDAYNASPASMAAVLRTFAALPGPGRRIAALGDMLELGPSGPELHAEVGRLVSELGLDLLVGAGPLMAHAVAAADIEAIAAADSEVAGAILKDRLRPGDRLLLKGSRGTRMERAAARVFDPEPPQGAPPPPPGS